MSKSPVSIVIPVHNGCGLLEKLLASIERQTSMPLEVIVVDNGSTDQAPDAAERFGARVIAMGRNAGFAAAVNRGIEAARGEAVALVNSDVELDAGWLEALWNGISRSGSDFGAGRILQMSSPDVIDGSYDLICRGGCPWRAGSGRRLSQWSDPESVIRFCPATAAIYRTAVFRRIGLFEERFESYLEDVDFGLRCAAAGLRGGYFPLAVCRHRGSATLGQWNPRVVHLIARNQLLLIARHYPAPLLLRWLWPIIAAQTLWGGLALRHGCGIAYLGGKLSGLRRFLSTRREFTRLPGIEPLIVESEQLIYNLQTRAGFDAYWKFYFRLAGVSK